MLHEVPAGIVGNYCMRYAMLQQLKGSDARALIAGAGFIYPNMHRDAGIVGGINGRGGCAVVDTGNPAGIAVGKDVDRRPVFLLADRFDKREAVLTNEPAVLHAFLGDIPGGLQGGGCLAFQISLRIYFLQAVANSIGEVDRSRAGLQQGVGCFPDIFRQAALICRSFKHSAVEPVGSRGTNEGRSPHVHIFDGFRKIAEPTQVFNHQLMRQVALIDNLNNAGLIGFFPDRTEVVAINFHIGGDFTSPENRVH